MRVPDEEIYPPTPSSTERLTVTLISNELLHDSHRFAGIHWLMPHGQYTRRDPDIIFTRLQQPFTCPKQLSRRISSP